jgi:4-hydroxy-2-oxoheptanedioate aldolase
MLENPLKTRWARDQTATTAWLHLGSAFGAQLVAAQGFDAVVVDHQHASIGMDGALGLIAAIGGAAVPLARVSQNDPAEIAKFLDAGALGVICPMVNSAGEAAAFARACRYPPRGARSYGPTRAAVTHGADYAAHADDAVVALAMIETAEALEHLEPIVNTAELDGVFVGPVDLGLSLGRGVHLDSRDPEFLETLARIAAVARGAGKVAGIFCGSPDYALEMARLGYRLVVLSTDARLLAGAARDALEAFSAGLRAQR